MSAPAEQRASTVRCPHCGRANRVPAAAEGTPSCGHCHRPLPWVTDAGDDDFAQVADHTSLPVLVDLWAPWCGPCRMVSPALEQLAVELAGRMKLVKVDVDQSPRIAARFAVQAVPTLIVQRGGDVLARQPGAMPLAALREWVQGALPPDRPEEQT
ncbi:thioredoxin [Actinomycetospora sp. CA-053990]|uniref:thioredoxin n=1 Tax=Actinomycetospora sp. CA-053990 TaxID=3239891 RepID=UPI003D93D67E